MNNPFNSWTIPTDTNPSDALKLALDHIQQSVRDMKALDNAGVINKSIFQGFDHSVKEREEFLTKFK